MNTIFDIILEKYKKVPDIEDYIKERSYNVDKFTFDKFWFNIDNDVPIIIDDNVITYAGYTSENKKNRKQDFVNMINANNIGFVEYNYEEYIKYIIDNNLELPEKTKNIQKTKFIIMSPIDFKEALMMAGTERGKQVRRYYIYLEKIIKEYNKFQGYFKDKELSRKDNEISNLKDILKEQSTKLDALLKNGEETKEEMQTIIENTEILKEEVADMSKDVKTLVRKKAIEPDNVKMWHKLIIIDISNITEGEHKKYDYYAIRAQAISADPKYETKCENGEKVYESGDFEANPINLYNKIKKYFRNNAEFRNNHIKLKENTNREDFLRKLINYCEVIKNDIDK
jgi:phage anti-repressor protein